MKGLAPGAKILSAKVRLTDSNADAIRYAVDRGADVLNLSYSGPSDAAEREAIKYATSKDAVVVAGSGNSGGQQRGYPASYPGVVSVGGLGRDGEVWDQSSWGSNLSLVAPAERNVTANQDYESGYGYTSGTSDATAYVAASAALVREKHPDLTAGQVINRLIETALPVAGKGEKPKLPDEKYGYGVVRPYRAVTYDIPAGPKAGPLEQAASDNSNTESSGKPEGAAGDSGSEDSSGWMFVLGPPIVLFGLMFVVLAGVVGLVIFLSVKKKRSKGPGGAGWGPPAQGGPQEQRDAPVGQFNGPSAPPPPGQPPR